MFHYQLAKYCFILALGTALCSSVSAQNQSTRVRGLLDSEVVIPTETKVLGRVDATALGEIQQHLKVVGAVPWVGMQGTGQITYGSDTTSSYSATLTIIGDKAFRLDAQTLKGALSIKINGKIGTIQQGDANPVSLPFITAASGLVQFEMLRTANFPDQAASFIDHGSGIVEGKTLHRITFAFSLNPKAATPNAEIVTTDLYLDPTSHLLVKSANAIRLAGSGENEFLRVITYEDYRQVSGSMVPFRYTETLNGQRQWTLQLSEAQLNPTLAASFFAF